MIRPQWLLLPLDSGQKGLCLCDMLQLILGRAVHHQVTPQVIIDLYLLAELLLEGGILLHRDLLVERARARLELVLKGRLVVVNKRCVLNQGCVSHML